MVFHKSVKSYLSLVRSCFAVKKQLSYLYLYRKWMQKSNLKWAHYQHWICILNFKFRIYQISNFKGANYQHEILNFVSIRTREEEKEKEKSEEKKICLSWLNLLGVRTRETHVPGFFTTSTLSYTWVQHTFCARHIKTANRLMTLATAIRQNVDSK